MLGAKQYSKEYIDSCRNKVQASIDPFESIKLVTEALEIASFCNMVLMLHFMFVHRLRGQEGKDGNPLNKVRMISTSILTNNKAMQNLFWK